MSDEAGARVSRRVGLPPVWTSVLAVMAHPDEASFGLGAILDAFFLAGTRVEVLCLTHGQAWTLHGAPGDLAALRGAALASGVDVLGPTREKMQDCRDGDLTQVPQTRLAVQVVAVADSCHPDGLLVFDTAELPGHLDHVAATSAALLAAETMDLPVLGWTLSESVAAQLNQESDARFAGPQHVNIDLRVTLDRARQRSVAPAGAARRHREPALAASRCDSGSAARRRRGHCRPAEALGCHVRGQPRHVRHRPQRPRARCLGGLCRREP